MLNIVFLVIYIVASNFLSGSELFILLSIHFGLNAVSDLRKKEIVITPIFIFYVGVIIANIANISLINQVEAHTVKTYSYIVPQFIDDAALIWCVSNALTVIGYNLAVKKSLPSIGFELNKKQVLEYLFWILFIANLLTIVGYGASMRGGQINKIFGLLNTIGILFFARLWARQESKTFRSYAIALFLIETYIALTTSYLRFELILPTFYLTVGYFIGKGNMRYIFSYRALPFIMIIVFYASIFSALQHNRSNFISAFEQQEDAAERTEEKSGGLLERSANLAQITNIVKLVERNGHYNGAASAPIITALIPRALWPDKPLIQLGAWFALEIGVGSRTTLGRSNNSINMTVPGELYLDFGWIGLVVGSILFGAFLAVLWNATKFYSSEYNLPGTIFGGYLFIICIGGYADLQVVVTLLSTYLIFFMIKKVVDHYAHTGYRPVMEGK